MKMDLKGLVGRDQQIKPSGADTEWTDLSAAYWDQSRGSTLAYLQDLGCGLARNTMPIDMGRLLRQVVDRAATIYRQPPARFLLGAGGKRLAESNAQHKLMLEVLERSQYDVTWRRIDRLRTLLHQVAVRFYPSDQRRAVVLRTFEPQHVLRDPDPACGDLMDHDRRFALRLDGGVYEYWYRHPDGSDRWCMAWTAEDGMPLDRARQPFGLRAEAFDGAEHYVSPYDVLPVQMVYADHPGGAPWLPPSQSRLAFTRTLTAVLNDVHALVTFQAHNTRVYKRRSVNNQLPEATGPGVTVNIDAEEDLFDLKPSPAIEQCLSVVKTMARLFATTEYLPGSEFDPEKQIVTGAALRVQLQPLYDRREDQVPLVLPDEQAAWRRLRGVHNVHAETWDIATLDSTTELDLEVADLEAPTTPTEAGNLAARQLELGTASVIDLIQRETSCTRPEAIKRYERVKADNESYPPLSQPGAQQEGPRMTGVPAADSPEPGPTAPDEQPDAALDGKPSVVEAIRQAG